MKIVKLLSFLKERRKIRKIENNIQQTRSSIINYHNTYIKKYPNLAVFAFDRVAADISIYGLYEREILEQLLKGCIFKNLKTSETICLDIGANLGNHTLFFAKFFDKVLSFEPHPETFELLKFNTRKLKNVSIFQFGLSNKDDDMKIGSIQDTHYGVASLRKEIDLNIKTNQNISN